MVDEDAVRIEHGLPHPCWALPRWIFEVSRSRLGERAGRIPGPQLEQLIEAVLDRYWGYVEDEPE